MLNPLIRVGEAIRRNAAKLCAVGIEGGLSEAKTLFLAASGFSRADLISKQNDTLSPKLVAKFDSFIARRATGEPAAYIVGRKDFWSLSFKVTPDVLIPRPETEGAVEAALSLLTDTPTPRILDIGTGSGAILISLLHETQGAQGVGADISEAALAVAYENADAVGVAGRAEFIKSDYLSNVTGKFDLIVSNPPYIDARAMGELPHGVAGYEPHLALAGGSDGLDAYRAIITAAPKHLRAGGALVLEIGFDQGKNVPALLAAQGFTDINVLPDLAGHDRIITALHLQK